MEINNLNYSLNQQKNNSTSNNNINFNYINKPSSNYNYQLYSHQNINRKKNANDFVFLCDELHLYREIPGIGNFTSYKNKSVKGKFNDKTICMMNKEI